MLLKFIADQKKLKQMLEKARVSPQDYEEILNQHQNLMARMINEVDAQKEKAKIDMVEKMAKRIQFLESLDKKLDPRLTECQPPLMSQSQAHPLTLPPVKQQVSFLRYSTKK